MTDHPIPITLAEQGRRNRCVPEAMARCIAHRSLIRKRGAGGTPDRDETILRVHPEDLLRDGFTHAELARYWARAKELVGETVTSLPEVAALAAFIGFVGCIAVSVGGA